MRNTRSAKTRNPRPVAAHGNGPSRALMTGALSGLLGLGGVGCGSDSPAKAEPDPVRPDSAAPACMCPPPPDAATCSPTPTTPDAAAPEASPASPDASAADAGHMGDDASSGGPMVTKETEATRTFANVTAECDTRGGYTQVHAACSGVNACAGFSYGDWDPGVTTEHTCAGVNGCNGISCVVLPKDSGKTGKDIYEAKLPETGPRSCSNCHAGYDAATKKSDLTKFKVYAMPGSDRNLTNWLARTPAEQARMVAFGSQARLPDGMAFAHMSAYHKLYSRAEIERVVEYTRTALQPLLVTIKIKD